MKLSFVTLFLFYTLNSYACSSCGSSATSPLILDKDENLKLYFGVSENYDFMNYGVKYGNATQKWVNPFITSKVTATGVVGYRTSENSFLTLTGSVVRNQGPANPSQPFYSEIKTKYLLGDPLISGRYNLSNMSFDNEYQPQIQIVASFKPKIAKNMADGDGDAIETTGNGYYQTSGGLDFWWGMPFIEFGGAQFLTYSFDRNKKIDTGYGTTITKKIRELQYTTIMTIGHTFKEQHFMLQGGIILDHIGTEHTTVLDNNTQVTTDVSTDASQSNSIFATINWYITKPDMIRFSYTHGGFYDGYLWVFTNSRQTTSQSVLVGYERTLY